MSDRVEKGSHARPGFKGAIKDLVESVGKAVAPKSITHRKAREDKAMREAEQNQKHYDGDEY